MPELPEVETIVRELRKKIVGLKITDVWADRPKTVQQAGGLENFRKQAKGRKILSVRRRAKYIIMDITGSKTIFIHQKISGHLLYGKWREKEGIWTSVADGPLKNDNRNGYIRFILFLNNGYQLGLSDPRRFAKVIMVDDDSVKDLKEISGLGPEPLEIGFNEFRALFKKKKGRIKQVLMDPMFVAGIGNIYSDEILWDAGFHPFCRAESMEEGDLKKIFVAMGKILKKAIRYQGSSNDDYRLPSGKKGKFQDIQNAYQQTGKKCGKKDGGVIARVRIGGRSAHFCPKHQILR